MQAKTATTRVRAGIGYALDEATKKEHCGLPVDERRPLALRRLRKRIANRTHMRQRRSDPTYYKALCVGVDLPLEAGTCGRHVNRSSGERCYRCWQRRRWLLNHAMSPYEIAVAGTLADEIEHDVADREREDDPHTDAIVPLLDAVDDMLAPADLYRSR